MYLLSCKIFAASIQCVFVILS